MKETVLIKGMMCEHCQTRVKKALESIPNVSSAEVNYEDGTAILYLKAPVCEADIKDAVESADYEFVSVLNFLFTIPERIYRSGIFCNDI